jgi:polysaccharide export outer membrane protein
MMPKRRRLATNGAGALLVLLLGMLMQAKVSSESQQVSGQSQTPTVTPSNSLITPDRDADVHLGVGDVVDITVDKAPELSGTYRVTSNGTFEIHFLGTIVALNKTPEELRSFISDGLRGRYLMDPRVAVVLKQRNSRPVYVNGAVRNAGVYQLEGRVSLLKLISVCGGLADNHGSVAFIFREGKGPVEPTASSRVGAASPESSSERNAGNTEASDYTFSVVNISGLLKGNLNENVIIESHDIINIPVADLFFVAGEVKAPGSFPLKAGTTLRQAISLAQGTTIQAAKSRAMIFREDPSTGKRIDMKIDVGAVMDGKIGDLAIKANDVIIVPNSKLKSVGAALLQSLGLNSTRTFYPH